MREIQARLSFLLNVGLDYLTLDRNAATLSGGEAQRIRLASQLGSELSGVMYVLDEPSIGLHQRDNARLIETLRRLRDLGNTVLVVEHDEETIRAADHVIDFGPGAGAHGGKVIFSGSPDDLARHPTSLTGAYLSGRSAIEPPGDAPRAEGLRRGPRRARAQPARHRRALPARRVHGRHGGERRGQELARQRHPPACAGARAAQEHRAGRRA